MSTATYTCSAPRHVEEHLEPKIVDGNNVRYLIKLPKADKFETAEAAAKKEVKIEKVSTWELERPGTALSTGDNPLPLGVALKISPVAVEAR